MIKYELINENKALKKSISAVSDRLHERVFATENIYVNGKLKTHKGIINKSCQLITDKSCDESDIILNYDGSINKFIVTISKEILCKTNISLNIQTNRLRAQLVILNNTNFTQCIAFHNINLSSSIIYINPHDFVILDTVCISKCCTGTFEKQPEEDLINNGKLNKSLINSDFFSDILNKVDLGSLENVQNNQNISNSILISKNGQFVLTELDKSHTVYNDINNIILHLDTFSNIHLFIEKHYDEIYINLIHKIKRGFVYVTNKTSRNINLKFTGYSDFTIDAHSKLTFGYSPYNKYLSKFINSYTVLSGDNITSDTLFEGIQEFKSNYHTSEAQFWSDTIDIPVINFVGDDSITHDYGVVFDYYADVSAVDQSGNNVYVTKTEGTVNVDTIGTYTITYSVTHGSGNVSTIDRIVTVIYTTLPTITFVGDSITHDYGAVFDYYADVSAVDQSGNNIYVTKTEGIVNIDTLGTYIITYSATDGSGNISTASRTVKVQINLIYENTKEYSNTEVYENYIESETDPEPESEYHEFVYENTLEYSNTELYENYIVPEAESEYQEFVYENTLEYSNTELYENTTN